MFKGLEAKGTRFLRGQLVLIAAGPGTGKSVFASTLAIKSRVPSLIFSADSDAFTQLTRAICITSDCTVAAASELVLKDNLSSVTKSLSGYPIRFNYDASPSLDTIETSLSAYEEVYGEYPALVVIDNITNVSLDGADEDRFESLEGLLDYLHSMARETGACVIGLHHVTGPYNDADKPVPLSGIKGQLGRVPELILTMHKVRGGEGQPDVLRVSTVKNRGGKADPSGNTFAELEFIGEKVTIRDFEYQAQVWDANG